VLNTIHGLGDRLLARLLPRGEASACGGNHQYYEYYYLCYCSGGLRYSKKCIDECDGTFCTGCNIVTGTC
jgi:hypothetical protein